MTALTRAHLDELTDEDLRTLGFRIVNDAISALNTNIEEYELTGHPDLAPAPVHEAADWLRKVLTNPDDGYSADMLARHNDAVGAFLDAAYGVGAATTGIGALFPPWLNAVAVRMIFTSVYGRGGTPHRPSAEILRNTLTRFGDGFIPSHETAIGYVLKAICGSGDPRLPALAETYLQSGLHVNLRPAINRATRQLARLDELTELNR